VEVSAIAVVVVFVVVLALVALVQLSVARQLEKYKKCNVNKLKNRKIYCKEFNVLFYNNFKQKIYSIKVIATLNQN